MFLRLSSAAIKSIFLSRYFAFLSILLVSNLCFGNNHESYPVPQKTNKLLFYLQRSHNKNTIVYELNTLADGTIDVKNPIKVSWIRFEEGGKRAELSFIQRRAFGVKCRLADKSDNSFIVQFNNFNKRDIRLVKTATGTYCALMKIDNETAELEDVYIKAENNAIGLPISFKYMDVYGISQKDRKPVYERITL
ncbi:hypothetical protein Palpr_2422 [Paludibacter propionicigenes WB4]|uniref:DUF4833 domain-containing protein n=1 Tax=Paludibacter propionicigenes (strain DSM 17365 / JCM 13257 / WB4) TaxID=694427 RepID=E4T760_PALPW|nr:DUF4833 domain-containing protein [Paludibacter propionicigenes]ADQ80554.1 hypothetical protein Palpr_2422 [Paludibacter propionicigenes WB4]